jgi:hypothetical protein
MIGSMCISLKIFVLASSEEEDKQYISSYHDVAFLSSINYFLIVFGFFYWMRMFNSVSM